MKLKMGKNFSRQNRIPCLFPNTENVCSLLKKIMRLKQDLLCLLLKCKCSTELVDGGSGSLTKQVCEQNSPSLGC